MSEFNQYCEHVLSELIDERIEKNRYDGIVRRCLNELVNYVKIGKVVRGKIVDEIKINKETQYPLQKYVFSINDLAKPFKIFDDPSESVNKCIRVFINVVNGNVPRRGEYNANKSIGKREMFVFLSVDEINLIRKSKLDKINGELYKSLMNDLFGTLRHEPQHLIEFGDKNNASIQKYLNKKFNNSDGYKLFLKNKILTSELYKNAKLSVDQNFGEMFLVNFKRRFETTAPYAFENREISAKSAEIKRIALKNKTTEIVEIENYIKTQFIKFSQGDEKAVEKYNNMDKIKEIEEFYKQFELFAINVFVNSICNHYKGVSNRLDKIELYGSTYSFNKSTLMFE